VTIEARDIHGQPTKDLNKECNATKLLEKSIYFSLPHIKQLERWDCGLCCLGMVLSATNKANCSLENLKQIHLGTVVWTLSLAYMLRDFGLKCTFYTIQRNICANYETDIFSLQQNAPDKEIFHKALAIVQEKEKIAEKNGIVIVEREISSEEFKQAIINGHVAIVLINSLFFGCLECHPDQFNEFTFCSMPIGGDPYRGHYVVISGYNPELDVYLFKNPSGSKEICFVPVSTFEHSRRTYGTQQNLLLVDLSKEQVDRIQSVV